MDTIELNQEMTENQEVSKEQAARELKQNLSTEDVQKILEAVSAKLEEKGAKKMEQIDVHEQTTLADYFLICTGTSTTHIRTLCQEVERLMETEYGMRAHHIEGYETAQWILVDFVFFVVHIFRADVREFYSLERLWG